MRIDFWRFRDKKGNGVKVEAQAVDPKATKSGKHAIKEHGLRVGMWVADTNNRVGILQNANEEGIATVMLVRDDGSNLLQINTMLGSLRQAKHKEIPAKRRPSADAAAQFGYK